jgi:hypothetical protein
MPKKMILAVCLYATLACDSQRYADSGFALLEGVDVTDLDRVDDAPILNWRLGQTPLVRIGGVGKGEDEEFVEISDAAFLTDGRVLVADGRTGLVRLFGEDGGFLGQLGARGQGPGEFQSPSSILLAPGDSIWIWDRILWQMSLFSPDGEFLRSERYDPTASGLYPVREMWPESVRLGGKGSRLIRMVSKSAAKAPNGDDLPLVGLAVHRFGASKLDLMKLLPREKQTEVEAPWGPQTLTPPLAAGPRITLDREEHRTCFGHQARPELLCLDSGGNSVGLRWSFQPRPVWQDDPDVDRWRDETMEAYSAKVSERDLQTMISDVPTPRFYPAFRDLIFDELGYLWVGLGPSSREPFDSEYVIIGRGLHLEGRLTVPTMTIVEIGASHILGIRQDSLGVDEVVAFSLRR